MNTLTDLKKRLKVGMVFRVEHLSRPEATGTRTVRKVQTNSMSYFFTKADGSQGIGWIDYPKAKHVTFDGDKVTFLDPHTLSAAFIYDFSEAPE